MTRAYLLALIAAVLEAGDRARSSQRTFDPDVYADRAKRILAGAEATAREGG